METIVESNMQDILHFTEFQEIELNEKLLTYIRKCLTVCYLCGITEEQERNIFKSLNSTK
jgi:hypothetical protein